MLESFSTDKFEYKKIPLEEQKRRGIIGRLVGVIADTVNPTRNGRSYGPELWKKVFESDIMKEKIANKALVGEFGHPTDREETDPEKIAICLAEQPKIGKDGKIYGVFDILDTNMGRILKTMCDYGCNIGISSRGSGDLITGYDGQEEVDPDTYNCEAWDAVLVPAVKEARLKYVTESLDTKKYNKTLRERLTEELDKASADEKKIMTESLNTLGIKLNEEENTEQVESETEEIIEEKFDPSSYTNAIKAISDGIKDDTNEEDLVDYLYHIYKYIKEIADDYNLTLCESTEQETNEPDEVVNDEAEEEIDAEFLESLAKNKQLTQDNLSLQEKLSVCTAKEVQLNEDLKKYKASLIRLSDKAKEVNSLNKEINSLKESLERKNNIIKVNNSKLGELLKENKAMKSYNEDLENEYSDLEKKEKSLSEQLNKLESENTKLNESLIKYKKAYNKAKDTIIESKAAAYGIDKEELLSNLNESYTIKDIDSKCKELSDRQRNMNSLPFRINKNSKVSIKESKEYISPDINNDDDDISSLIKLL